MRFVMLGRRSGKSAAIARLQAEVDRLRVEKAMAADSLYVVREAYRSAIDHGDHQAFLSVGAKLDAAVTQVGAMDESLVDRRLYEPLALGR